MTTCQTLSFLFFNSPNRAWAAWLLSILDHIQLDRHTRQNSLNEWSARRRGRYLHVKQLTQETNIHALRNIRASDPSNHALLELPHRPQRHRYQQPPDYTASKAIRPQYKPSPLATSYHSGTKNINWWAVGCFSTQHRKEVKLDSILCQEGSRDWILSHCCDKSLVPTSQRIYRAKGTGRPGLWARTACSFRSAQAATLLEIMYHSRIVLSVGGSVWYMIRNLRCTVTIDSVLARHRTLSYSLWTPFFFTTTP